MAIFPLVSPAASAGAPEPDATVAESDDHLVHCPKGPDQCTGGDGRCLPPSCCHVCVPNVVFVWVRFVALMAIAQITSARIPGRKP